MVPDQMYTISEVMEPKKMISHNTNFKQRIQQADIFKLLAACFYKPEAEILIESDLPGTLASLALNISEEAYRGALLMKEAVEKYTIEDLQVEYTRLLIGPFGLLVPPYGSYYLENNKELMGETTSAVSRIYLEAGLSIDDYFKELPDHIALELEFIYYLLISLSNPDVTNDEKYFLRMNNLLAEFYTVYFLPFVKAFTNKLSEKTNNDFYIGLSCYINAIIKDVNILNISPLVSFGFKN